eukprot:m.893671 g.893671  ORF g.893671 m.893671 type:complete len:244 (-) comp23662_c1_seq10:113-844(-)
MRRCMKLCSSQQLSRHDLRLPRPCGFLPPEGMNTPLTMCCDGAVSAKETSQRMAEEQRAAAATKREHEELTHEVKAAEARQAHVRAEVALMQEQIKSLGEFCKARNVLLAQRQAAIATLRTRHERCTAQPQMHGEPLDQQGSTDSAPTPRSPHDALGRTPTETMRADALGSDRLKPYYASSVSKTAASLHRVTHRSSHGQGRSRGKTVPNIRATPTSSRGKGLRHSPVKSGRLVRVASLGHNG